VFTAYPRPKAVGAVLFFWVGLRPPAGSSPPVPSAIKSERSSGFHGQARPPVPSAIKSERSSGFHGQARPPVPSAIKSERSSGF
jgi:hypothetical protein